LSVKESTECGWHEEHSTAYEQLRSQVLGVNGKPPRDPGLAFFLEHAMKAWIDAYLSGQHFLQPASSTLSTIDNLVYAG
jgi:hypothetical protein